VAAARRRRERPCDRKRVGAAREPAHCGTCCGEQELDARFAVGEVVGVDEDGGEEAAGRDLASVQRDRADGAEEMFERDGVERDDAVERRARRRLVEPKEDPRAGREIG
jgi:hypothetical protein